MVQRSAPSQTNDVLDTTNELMAATCSAGRRVWLLYTPPLIADKPPASTNLVSSASLLRQSSTPLPKVRKLSFIGLPNNAYKYSGRPPKGKQARHGDEQCQLSPFSWK